MTRFLYQSRLFRACLALLTACAAVLGCAGFGPAYADNAYEAALDQLTDPTVYHTPYDLRRPYSKDACLDAKTAAFRRLQKDGVQSLWELSGDVMRSLAIDRLKQSGEEYDETVSDQQLMTLFDPQDLTLTDCAPMCEKSWFDFQLSGADVGYDYAIKNISAYMFSITCDGKYVGLIRAAYRKDGSFRAAMQPYPNIYYNLYRQASEQLPEQQYPILLTDPRTYQAVSFLIPGRMEDTVMVKNYISSSSKDESLSVDAETFLIAARKWNRDTISVLLDASGSIRPDATVVYNNLESYVRSELRIAAKEHLLRTTCVLISLTLTVCFGAMILNMYRVRFLDEDDPRRKVSFYLRTLLDKVIQRKEA